MRPLLLFSLLNLLFTARLFAQDRIPAKEAAKYIGEIKRVYGYVNDGAVLQNQDGSFTEILYLGNSADHLGKYFVLISKGFRLNGWDIKKYQRSINIEKNLPETRFEVTGRIFIYNRKPAIAVDYMDVMTFERKD